MRMQTPFPIAEFADQINGLANELLVANLHFQIGTGLRKAWRSYFDEIKEAPVFWQYTIHSHDTMAVLGLCRVYDNTRFGDKSCLTLQRFLATVENNPGVFGEAEFRKRLEQRKNPYVGSLVQQLPKLDPKQVAEDMSFCEHDSAVKHLQNLRNKVIAHLDYEYIIGAQKNFAKSNPLPYDDIQRLIDEGFRIVNRYSGLFSAMTHSERVASRQDQDFLNVLNALKRLREMNL